MTAEQQSDEKTADVVQSTAAPEVGSLTGHLSNNTSASIKPQAVRYGCRVGFGVTVRKNQLPVVSDFTSLRKERPSTL